MKDPYDRPAPRYVGFADPRPDLYEFRTEAGTLVYLHDLDCVRIEYLPLTRTLSITFDGGPTEVLPAMTVELSFADAEIYQWQALGEPVDQSVVDAMPRVRGQISDFGSMSGSRKTTGESFHLTLLDVAISFFASVVTCEVHEGV